MSLEERIEKEFKEALKDRNELKVSTLRMVKAAINNLRLDGNKKDLGEQDIMKIIQQQIKQHRDSIEQFKKGNREDLVGKESKELAILQSYMPKQLTEEELKKLISDAVSELGATSKKDMGKVIKAVMEKVKGKAEGKTVSQIVGSILA